MYTRLRLVLCASLVCAGCITPPRRAARTGRLTLDERESALAVALARYGQALIYESELGWSSPRTADKYAEALQMDPGQPRLYNKAAALYLHQKKPEKAVQVLRDACRADPGNAQARGNLAIACEADGRPDEAIGHYTRAIALEPRTPSYYTRLAALYFRGNNDRRALRILAKGLKESERPNSIIASCYSIGAQFAASDRIERAVPCFRLIMRHDPSQSGPVLLLVGELYENAGDIKQALRYYTHATAIEPPSAQSFLKLGAAQMQMNMQSAVKSLAHGTRLFPDDPRLLFALGFAQALDEQFRNGIKSFKRVEEIVAESPETMQLSSRFYLYYGMCYERTRQFGKAEKVFEKCLESHPDAHDILNYLAYMWAENDSRLEKGLEYVTRALELDPENAAYIDTLGWIYYKQGRYKEALEQVLKATGLLEDDPTIADHLGDIFSALADSEKAVLHWRRSLILAPDNETVALKLKSHGIDPDDIRREARREKKVPAPKEETGDAR